MSQPSGPGPAEGTAPQADGERPRSGLRNPDRAVRGLGAGALILEAVVLLLAIQPIRMLGGALSGAAIGLVVALAVLAVLLASQLRHAWAWWAAAVLQGLLVLSVFLNGALGVLGLIFALAWAYALYVRRIILGGPRRR